jgi:hypothetical protein
MREAMPSAAEARTGQTLQAGGLLQARRRFLVGSVGVSAFAATLASRPAFAGGGGGCGPITALCSPTHSGSQHGGQGCVGQHCDYWCSERTRWPVDCNSATFSSCGFEPPPGCNFSGSVTLKNAICSAYLPSSTPTGRNQAQVASNYSGGWWSYSSGCNTSNLQCWIACGLLNAISPETCSGFGYNQNGFIEACTTALKSRNPECYTNIQVGLCATISSICTQGRSSTACGGPPSVWG